MGNDRQFVLVTALFVSNGLIRLQIKSGFFQGICLDFSRSPSKRRGTHAELGFAARSSVPQLGGWRAGWSPGLGTRSVCGQLILMHFIEEFLVEGLGKKTRTPQFALCKACGAELARGSLRAGTSRSGAWAILSWENISGGSGKNLNSVQTTKTVVLQQIN